MHRTHFLRKGFELSHSKMLFHDPVQITRRFVTPYLELALNIDYSAAWSVDGFYSEHRLSPYLTTWFDSLEGVLICLTLWGQSRPH